MRVDGWETVNPPSITRPYLDMSTFEGFQSPTTTPIPDEVLDYWIPQLEKSEIQVLLYICRRTFGWRKAEDAISYSQFLHGVKTRDGKVLDAGCGVAGKSTLSRALDSLEEKGAIIRTRSTTVSGDKGTTVYRLRFRSEAGEGTPTVVPEVLPTQEHPTPTVVPRVVPPAGPRVVPPVGHTPNSTHQTDNTKDTPPLRGDAEERIHRASNISYLNPIGDTTDWDDSARSRMRSIITTGVDPQTSREVLPGGYPADSTGRPPRKGDVELIFSSLTRHEANQFITALKRYIAEKADSGYVHRLKNLLVNEEWRPYLEAPKATPTKRLRNVQQTMTASEETQLLSRLSGRILEA